MCRHLYFFPVLTPARPNRDFGFLCVCMCRHTHTHTDLTFFFLLGGTFLLQSKLLRKERYLLPHKESSRLGPMYVSRETYSTEENPILCVHSESRVQDDISSLGNPFGLCSVGE